MLVEDSVANQMVVSSIVEACGCEVSIASDGTQAIEKVMAHEFDMIFMDLSMPGMDGTEVTRQIRSKGGWYADVPIVAMTANVFKDDQERCFAAGMNDFIGKPIEATHVRAKLRQWLTQNNGEEDEEVVNSDLAETMAANANAVWIDDKVLEELERETSAELVKIVIGVFINETKGRLHVLRDLNGGPLEEIINASHALKSSSGTFGASQLCEAARRVEDAARAGRDQDAQSMIASLLVIGDETMDRYVQRFGEPEAAVDVAGEGCE